MEHVGGVVRHRRQIEAVEELEGHRAGDAGAGEGRDAHGVTAVLELEAFVPDFRFVACHVIFGEDAAVCLNVGGDRLGDVALVEGVGSALAYCFEDVGEFGLLENRAVNDIAHRQVAAGPEYAAQFVVAGDHS